MRSGAVFAACAIILTLMLPSSAAVEGGLRIDQSAPPEMSGRLDIALPSAVGYVRATEGTTLAMQGVDGEMVIQQWQEARATGPAAVSRPVGEPTTTRITLTNATLTWTSGRTGHLDMVLHGGATAHIESEVEGKGHATFAPSRVVRSQGSAPSPLPEVDHIAWEIPAGWPVTGSTVDGLSIRSTFLSAPMLSLDGALTLEMSNPGTLLVEMPGSAAQRYELGPTDTSSVATFRENAIATLRATHARARIEPTGDWLIGASQATWQFNGTLAFPRATGSTSAPEARTFADRLVTMTGAITLEAAPPATAAASPSYAIHGDLSRLTVGPDVVIGAAQHSALAPPIPATWGVLALLLAFAAFIPEAGRTLTAKGAAVLYTRIAPADLTCHPTRAAIMERLRETPGIHVRELHRRIGGAWGPFTFHLTMLERARFVTVRTTSGHSLVMPMGVAPSQDVLPVGERILAALPADGAAVRLARLREELDISRQLLRYHLKRLAADGAVIMTDAGRASNARRVIQSENNAPQTQ